MSKLFMVRNGNTLVPVAPMWSEKLDKFKEGVVMEVEVHGRRNIAHHNLYWGLMAFLVSQQDTYSSAKQLSNKVKIALGHCDTYEETIDGKFITVVEPRSISFAKMDQAEFDAFWDRVVKVICARIIPNLDESVGDEVLKMLGN